GRYARSPAGSNVAWCSPTAANLRPASGPRKIRRFAGSPLASAHRARSHPRRPLAWPCGWPCAWPPSLPRSPGAASRPLSTTRAGGPTHRTPRSPLLVRSSLAPDPLHELSQRAQVVGRVPVRGERPEHRHLFRPTVALPQVLQQLGTYLTQVVAQLVPRGFVYLAHGPTGRPVAGRGAPVEEVVDHLHRPAHVLGVGRGGHAVDVTGRLCGAELSQSAVDAALRTSRRHPGRLAGGHAFEKFLIAIVKRLGKARSGHLLRRRVRLMLVLECRLGHGSTSLRRMLSVKADNNWTDLR